MDYVRVAFVACFCVAIGACQSPDAALLTVTADAPAEQYELFVRDDSNGQIVFKSGWQPVELAGEKPRDLTQDQLKIALKLTRSGRFTFLMVGVKGELADDGKPADGATQLFWAQKVQIKGTTYLDAKLLTVQPGDDQDRDLWPDAAPFVAHTPGAAALYQSHPEVLDCDDKLDLPEGEGGAPIPLLASAINPFATEVCGDGFDEDCNGDADEACVDGDGDGDNLGSDCDDADPGRHHANPKDPFPDPPNCCGYSLGKIGTSDENKDFTGDPLLCPARRCGDGIDQSCRGGPVNEPSNDTACVVDNDCDGFPAQPAGADCDDAVPGVHPGAPEICGDGIDQNCNGVVDDGCQPCDLDGDGYQRNDAANGCPDQTDKHPGQFDCNDYDSGVFPGQTAALGSKEGGAGAAAMQQSALRGNCRRVYEPTGTTGTAKVASFAQVVGDADCNGTAWDGCPSVACDADGDGWPNATAGCNPNGVIIDCNDSDPTIYPGAPDKCGNGKAENCTADAPCGSSDKDGDGYLAPYDCNDNDASVHPWAVESCNGVDDDCDGLTDEGNPDPMGKPMVDATAGQVTSCTDSNVGECQKTRGTCVCSAAMEQATYDPQGRRDQCPGESSGAPKPPRCFGAGQPRPQSCDNTNPKDDDCDGRLDDPEGSNLAMKGQPCGVSVGQCKAGTVVGCDMSKSNCFTAFGRTAANTLWYVCSTETVCPQAELCNGLDDDCDGQLAGAATPPAPFASSMDERDHDADKVLACAGCDPAKLAMGLTGCGDCDDARNDTYPGAPEKCDNYNNACDPSWAASSAAGGVDGKDQCTGATPNCCSSQQTCRNLGTDVNNCVTCGTKCDALKANQCGAGGCLCGGAAACGAGQYCGAAGCAACNDHDHCGASCVNCGAGAVCKTDGSGCTQCNVDGDCASTQWCRSGACVARTAQGGACTAARECTLGLFCTDGVCCTSSATDCNGCRTCARANMLGTCQNVPANSDPHAVCTASKATCQGDYCNGSGSCAVANGTVCVDQTCASAKTMDSRCLAGTCTAQTPVDCSGHLTCASATTCLTSCTADAQCVSGYFCSTSTGTCAAQRAAGQTCMRTAQCTTGLTCVDGVCCNTASCATCQECQAVTGNCAAVAAGLTDDDSCAGVNQVCDGTAVGAGACKLKDGAACTAATASTCLHSACVDDVCCSDACNDGVPTCSGNTSIPHTCAGGTCNLMPMSCAANYTCEATSGLCATSCSCGVTTAPCADAVHCASTAYCDGAACQPKVGNGQDCTDPAQCASGNCDVDPMTMMGTCGP